MYSVDIRTDKEGYTIIRLADKDGVVCSYCGFDSWPMLALFTEHGIDCRHVCTRAHVNI